MAIILDGKTASDEVMEELAKQVETLKQRGVTPGLALVLTGEDKNSERYVKLKQRRAESIGIYTEFHHLGKTTDKELVEVIKKLNDDSKIHGVMVQLPLAEGLNELTAVEAIAPEKDVDALSPHTLGKILMGEEAFPPAGVEAIMDLLRRNGIDPEHKHWVIVGKSNFLSKPLAATLANMKTSVTLIGPNHPNMTEIIKQADVLSTEISRKHAVTKDMVKNGVIVIDNGNNYEGRKVFGDVDTEGVSEVAKAITPVPGGVGPMLITMLMKNTLKATRSSVTS
jgi:methylenetetrahydrofolate dehydrogenase (NADP+)/methenyltetrahydrofolate cyclohydrolase